MESIIVERLVEINNIREWKLYKEIFNLEEDFSIDEENLNREICRMGQLLARYGTIDAEMNANLKRKEEQVKLVKAQVSGAIRSQAEATSTKMTETKLDEQVTIHNNYQQILNELHVLRADALKVDHWWRSIVKKADLLNALAFRQNAEIKRMPG